MRLLGAFSVADAVLGCWWVLSRVTRYEEPDQALDRFFRHPNLCIGTENAVDHFNKK